MAIAQDDATVRHRPLADIYSELGEALLARANAQRRLVHADALRRQYSEAAHAFRDAIRERPNDPDLYQRLAVARQAEGLETDAALAYLEAARLAPARIPEIVLRVELLVERRSSLDLGQVLSRCKLLGSVPDLDRKTVASIFRLMGDIELAREAWQDAQANLEKAHEADPDDAAILAGVGMALHGERQLSEAAVYLQRAVERAKDSGDTDLEAASRVKLSGVLVELGDLEEAREVIQAGLLRPSRFTAELQGNLAYSYLEQHDFEQAARIISQALQDGKIDEPYRTEAQLISARSQLGLENFERAAQVAETILESNPTHPEAVRIRAEALVRGGTDREQGIRLLQSYLRQNPTDSAAVEMLLEALRASGRAPAEIAATVVPLIRSVRDQTSLWIAAAELYVEAGLGQEAEKALESARSFGAAETSVRWWSLRGALQQQAGELIGAEQSYQRAAELDPLDAGFRIQLAQLRSSDGNYESAIETLREALKLNPYSIDAMLALADALYQTKHFEEALEHLDIALGMVLPTDVEGRARDLKVAVLRALNRPPAELAEALLFAAKVKYDQDQYAKAEDLLAEAVEADPSNPLVYWRRAESARMYASALTDPDQMHAALSNARRYWEQGSSLRPPSRYPDESWVYVTWAFLNSPAFLPDLGDDGRWIAIAYLERAILLQDLGDSTPWAALSSFQRSTDPSLQLNAIQTGKRAVDINPRSTFALEQYAAVLANTGVLDEARSTIESRLAIGPDSWSEAVYGFILMNQGDYLAAASHLSSFDARWVVDGPWVIETRAQNYWLLGDLSRARADYEALARAGKPEDKTNQETYAAAVLSMGLLDRDPQLVERAIHVYAAGDSDSRSLGLAKLALGQFAAAQAILSRYIGNTVEVRTLDELEHVDLAHVRSYLEDTRATGPEMTATFDALVQALVTRRGVLAKPRSLEDELLRIEAKPSTPVWLAVQATLGRLCTEQKRWLDAAEIYRSIRAAAPDFLEVGLGLERVRNGLSAAGDLALSQGRPRPAIESFNEALRLTRELAADDADAVTPLLTRLAVTALTNGQTASARARFAEALLAQREAGASDPSDALGQQLREVVSTTSATALLGADQTWDALASGADLDSWVSAQLPRVILPSLEDMFQLGTLGSSASMPRVRPVAVRIGEGLIVGESTDEQPLFQSYLPEMRQRIKNDTAITVPGINFERPGDLGRADYLIMLDEIPLAFGEVQLGMGYCPVAPDRLLALGIPDSALIPTDRPGTAEPGCWVDQPGWEPARTARFELWTEPILFVVDHLERILRRNLGAFLGVQEVQYLLDEWRTLPEGEQLVEAVLTDGHSPVRVARILRALLEERVSISDWRAVLRAVRDSKAAGGSMNATIKSVRQRLKPYLPGNGPGAQRVELQHEWEPKLVAALRQGRGRVYLEAPPRELHEFMVAVGDLLVGAPPGMVLIAPNADLRPIYRRMVKGEYPDLMVLAREEVL
jgi:tetratricopeptide (TPR) repeat protein